MTLVIRLTVTTASIGATSTGELWSAGVMTLVVGFNAGCYHVTGCGLKSERIIVGGYGYVEALWLDVWRYEELITFGG